MSGKGLEHAGNGILHGYWDESCTWYGAAEI